ncbi:Hint domain-containing protein [Pseudoroseomonas cervicalis]|uniref:Hint domain-containing protein n=1 Tax=Teichococcus cervicalis TaxID=204525 RepID=UPI00277ECFFB|nr:Hint domain-containing protein [Pseudoroseomonas cervicalis]MDQ1080458.1 hypothetical protein [Pseudoroseomonas cervicalis]
MAILSFAHGYAVWGTSTAGNGGSVSGVTIDTGDATVLEQGDTFALNYGAGEQTWVFSYASDDGFVAYTEGFPSNTYLFTNNTYAPNTPVANEGSSFVTCFLEGTRIATPAGEVPVESLAIGEQVTTLDGSARPVRWIGRRTIATRFADPRRQLPMRIAAGALGQGLPKRDLLVSPDHALLLDGLLVQAGALIGQPGIATAYDLPDRVTYYHIELEDHALVLAEGAAAETFVDNATRQSFDNYDEFLALYGEAPAPTGEIDLPRVKSARQLPARWRHAA